MFIKRSPFIFVLLFLSYAIVNFLFLPHNHFIGHPIYMDDYKMLISSFDNIAWKQPRPVMSVITPLSAHLGMMGFYLAMLIGDVLISTMVLYFIEKFLRIFLKPNWIVFYGVVLFSFPFILDASKFLGLLINLT
jgi:hypothetical protein